MTRESITRPIRPRPYTDWEEGDDRVYEAERALGVAISQNLEGNLPILKRRLQNAYPSVNFDELDPVLREAAWSGVYYVMMVLDGIAPSSIDEDAIIAWRVDGKIYQIADESKEPAETINILPKGDGLCYAFHDWHNIEEK